MAAAAEGAPVDDAKAAADAAMGLGRADEDGATGAALAGVADDLVFLADSWSRVLTTRSQPCVALLGGDSCGLR